MNFAPRHLHSVAPEKDLGGEHVFPCADRKFMEFIPVVFQIAADRPPAEKFPVEIQIVAAVRTDQQTQTRRRTTNNPLSLQAPGTRPRSAFEDRSSSLPSFQLFLSFIIHDFQKEILEKITK